MAVDARFDDAIHAPNRLRLCAVLRPVDSADFGALRETLDLSEANLSKTVRKLVEVGYVGVRKEPSPHRADARRTTSISLTAAGRRAVDGHLAALRELADAAGTPGGV